MKSVKGTRDFTPSDLFMRRTVECIIRDSYHQFAGLEYQTPLLEQTCFLQKKYGDDTKLIFDIVPDPGTLSLCTESGGSSLSNKEQTSLRYDLTIPFTRFCLMNSIQKGSYYQIGKVFRKDVINQSKGRFREFVQCDYDIVGAEENQDVMLPETIILYLATLILKRLGISGYVIKVNHRQELISKLSSAGVPDELLLTICSSIDKLDKYAWDVIDVELYQKGLSKETISNLRDLLKKSNAGKWLETLKRNAMNLEFDNNIVYVPELARGMDYYTGLIYEIVYPSSSIGSIISGGRYDNLTRMFRPIDLSMCGISIGLERIMELKAELKSESNADCFNNKSNKYLICRTSDNQEDVKTQLSELKLAVSTGQRFEVEYKARSRSKLVKYARKNKLVFS